MSIRTGRPLTLWMGVLALCSLLPIRAAKSQPPSSVDDCIIHCVSYKMDIPITKFPGEYISLQFLAADAAGRETIRSYLSSPIQLAGVQHIFIVAEPSDEYLAMAKSATNTMVHFTVDQGGMLAARFGVRPEAGGVVVLDRDRKELWRVDGPSGSAMNSDAFAARLRSSWRPAAVDQYNLPKGSTLAVQGYDVVAYFMEDKARKGDPKFVSEYRGVTYRFSSAKNRDAFNAAPVSYLPTFGGWCASAIGAKGEKVEIDPTSFKVKDGRLFLFYKGIFADALKDWNKNEKAWEPAADANWKKIAGEDPVRAAKGVKE
ncbi:MAG: YHS domain-containing (seleno)protein [Phycisphaerales bacterium]